MDELKRRADGAFASIISDKKLAFLTNVGKLNALNPLSVLERGYSVAQKEGKAISHVADVEVDDTITVRLLDGSVSATVRSKTLN